MAENLHVSAYPVRLQIAHPEGGNRFMILVRWFLAIPHYFVFGVLSAPIWISLLLLAWILADTVGGTVSGWNQFLSWFPLWAPLVVALGRLPEEIFDYFVGLERYWLNIGAYVFFHDEYPPFSMSAGEYAPVTFEVDRPASSSRGLPLVKWLLAIPHFLVLMLIAIISLFVYLYVWLAVLFTGRYPEGGVNFMVGCIRWGARVNSYSYYLLTDKYPPFSLEDDSVAPPAPVGTGHGADELRSL